MKHPKDTHRLIMLLLTSYMTDKKIAEKFRGKGQSILFPNHQELREMNFDLLEPVILRGETRD